MGASLKFPDETLFQFNLQHNAYIGTFTWYSDVEKRGHEIDQNYHTVCSVRNFCNTVVGCCRRRSNTT